MAQSQKIQTQNNDPQWNTIKGNFFNSQNAPIQCSTSIIHKIPYHLSFLYVDTKENENEKNVTLPMTSVLYSI